MIFNIRQYGKSKKSVLPVNLISPSILLMIFSLALIIFPGSVFGASQPVVDNGVIDLRNWNFDKQGIVKLNGKWEFFWNHWLEPGKRTSRQEIKKEQVYIDVPAIWNGSKVKDSVISGSGYATYRIRLLLPDGLGSCSIHIPEAGSAYFLYVDGKKYRTVGKPAKNIKATVPRIESVVASFTPQHREMEILILISSFRHRCGGLWETIRFGPSDQIHAQRLKKVSLNFFVFGAILIMGLYHLGLFFIQKKERTAIIFSGFCMLMALRVMVMGESAVDPKA